MAGFEISVEPVFELERSASDSHLGRAIISALNAFETDVTPPAPHSMDTSPVLKALKTKSWRHFERVALHVSVTSEGATVQVMPTARDPHRGGYIHQPDQICECALQPQAIEDAVLRALEQCS